VLHELHGGCTIPLGVRCECGEFQFKLSAFLGKFLKGSYECLEAYKRVSCTASERSAGVKNIISELAPLISRGL